MLPNSKQLVVVETGKEVGLEVVTRLIEFLDLRFLRRIRTVHVCTWKLVFVTLLPRIRVSSSILIENLGCGFRTVGALVESPATGNLIWLVEEMDKVRARLCKGSSKQAGHRSRLDYFMKEERDSRVQHVGFLSLWLLRFVFCLSTNVTKEVFPIAALLSSGVMVSLGPAVLAGIYQSLRILRNRVALSLDLIAVTGPLRLVQSWGFERFPLLLLKQPNLPKPGEPRAACWHKLGSKINLKLFLQPCDLVGIGCREKYRPHRVAMQFGLDQDLPGDSVSSGFGSENVVFFIPPRSLQPGVSSRCLRPKPRLEFQRPFQDLSGLKLPLKFTRRANLASNLIDHEPNREPRPDRYVFKSCSTGRAASEYNKTGIINEQRDEFDAFAKKSHEGRAERSPSSSNALRASKRLGTFSAYTASSCSEQRISSVLHAYSASKAEKLVHRSVTDEDPADNMLLSKRLKSIQGTRKGTASRNVKDVPQSLLSSKVNSEKMNMPWNSAAVLKQDGSKVRDPDEKLKGSDLIDTMSDEGLAYALELRKLLYISSFERVIMLLWYWADELY
ncbi:hypothetical protein CRG98_011896 [Punica granatum]|uniref:Aminotransferase-like plant mobile domain-containing protein n=1 Tax=Punica granatum TaxID=22663 RepID=A0A2I0KHL1_PUNGR|nr:hypothetical protein CRG98_011896 [Punica granatum]